MRSLLWSITLFRIALIPIFVWAGHRAQNVAWQGGDPASWRAIAIGAVLVMGLSDVLDGWMARRFALDTQVGAVVDAVADKLAQVVMVVFFAVSLGPVFTTLPLWFLIVVFTRDLVLLVGYTMLRTRYGTIRIQHRWHGRAASIGLSFVLLWCTFGLPPAGLTPLLVATAVVSVVSAVVYSLDGDAQGRAIRAALQVTTPGRRIEQ